MLKVALYNNNFILNRLVIFAPFRMVPFCLFTLFVSASKQYWLRNIGCGKEMVAKNGLYFLKNSNAKRLHPVSGLFWMKCDDAMDAMFADTQ